VTPHRATRTQRLESARRRNAHEQAVPRARRVEEGRSLGGGGADRRESAREPETRDGPRSRFLARGQSCDAVARATRPRGARDQPTIRTISGSSAYA
jgi:hypothetical protein